MASKSRRSITAWVTCDKCRSILSQKDTHLHATHCPPSTQEWVHNYVKDGILYSTVERYSPKELPKNISEKDTHDLVFMSQSALELCQIPISDKVIVTFKDVEFVKIAWPTNEKSLTSVCLAQHTMELNKVGGRVKIRKFTEDPPVAKEIVIKYVGRQPNQKVPLHELKETLKKIYDQKVFCIENRLNVPFYGKRLLYCIEDIISDSDQNAAYLTNASAGTSNESELVEDSDKNSNESDLHEDSDKNSNASDLIDEIDLIKQLESMNLIKETPKFYEVIGSTIWTIIGHQNDSNLSENSQKLKTIEDIGGYQHLLDELRDVFDIVLGKCTKVLKGFKLGKGILIYGTTGVGKTSIVQALTSEYDVNYFVINATDMYSKYFDERDKKLSSLFAEAISSTPTVIIIEDIDMFSSKKTSSENEKRLLATLIEEIDKLQESEVNTLLIATSSKPDSIDVSLRRAGRIDREFEISAPTPVMRRDILQKLLAKLPNTLKDEELDEIAFVSHGFVAADLHCLCSQAAMRAIKRHELDDSKSSDVFICGTDFTAAFITVKPSAMKEVLVEVPNVKWSDIGGQQSLKLKLKQAVEWPLKHPEAFTRLGITPPRGVLMFGPPGCSKTMVARALATESKLNFINIKGPELFSKWVGESERAVREVFRKARQVAPSIIFIDEIDALGGERASGNSANTSNNVQERVLAQLLTELDGVTALGNVTLVAATNRPDRIDKALLRPGRLDRIVYVPLPDVQTRQEIFQIKFRKMPIADDVIIQDLVELTEGYSGAEIQAICHEAAMNALEEDLEAKIITKQNFKAALSIVWPRTPASLVKLYEDYENNR